jgi:hypothetical protein
MAHVVEEQGEWQAAHAALVELSRSRAGLDLEEGRWLLSARRSQTHARLGYGSFTEYIERLFGYSPRLTHDKLRVAEALEALPELAESLRQGASRWSCLRELTRVATPETERAWLEQARSRTTREVEKLVSGHRPGSLPDEPPEPALQRHCLRFEVSGEVLATFREALAKLRRDAGGHLEDDDALLLMARQVLGGPVDDGRASYQVELTVCEECERTLQRANVELVEVSPEAAAMASCDSQRLPSAHGGEDADGKWQRATQDVPPAMRRAVLRRDRHRCRVPSCRNADYIDLHHLQSREEGGSHDPENLITLCGAHHRAFHGGRLRVVGSPSNGLTFRHADGTSYGGVVSAPSAARQTEAFQALRGLGFKEKAARGALERATRQLGDDAELQLILRHALQLLTENACQRSA